MYKVVMRGRLPQRYHEKPVRTLRHTSQLRSRPLANTAGKGNQVIVLVLVRKAYPHPGKYSDSDLLPTCWLYQQLQPTKRSRRSHFQITRRYRNKTQSDRTHRRRSSTDITSAGHNGRGEAISPFSYGSYPQLAQTTPPLQECPSQAQQHALRPSRRVGLVYQE